MSKVIWLTGFGPFPGVTDNPTAAVVAALSGARVGGFEIAATVLPTSYEGAAKAVASGFSQVLAAVVMLGVARHEREIRVESTAANEQTASIPDVDGFLALGQRCSPHFAVGEKLRTTLDVEALAARLRRHSLAARASDDAGRYVCNSSYFNALATSARQTTTPLRKTTPVVFIHVPHIGQPRATGGARWQLSDLVLAARVVIVGVADSLTGRVTGPIF